MKYLLDTCLISELVKKEPSAAVLRWLDEQDEQRLFISVLVLGELNKGVAKLAAGDRKQALLSWVEHDLAERFEGRIVGLDLETAILWGRMQGEAEKAGEKLPVMDSLIAATAMRNGFTVVTRNVRDLQRCGAPLFNPWETER